MEARQERFTLLYQQCVDRVMIYCLRHLDAGAAEDVVSETFTIAWRRLDELREHPLPWLLTTAHNLIRNNYRSRASQRSIAQRMTQLTQLAAEPAEVTASRRHDLLTALGALADADREALLLTAWDGLSSAEAARLLGCSPGALRVRIHRARRTMAEALHPSAAERSGHA